MLFLVFISLKACFGQLSPFLIKSDFECWEHHGAPSVVISLQFLSLSLHIFLMRGVLRNSRELLVGHWKQWGAVWGGES